MVVALGFFVLRSALTMTAEVMAAITGRDADLPAPKPEAI
jgi:hypothetical protein